MPASTIRDEVAVIFYKRRKRDTVMVNSSNLFGYVDEGGKPTAGIRLEIPPELRDTFRLLSRFGTRLRARHGGGTRRHIRFDDFEGSLFANIKLPGDIHWTRITSEMAKEDLDASMREESSATQKSLAAKLTPGPRDRLHCPMPIALPARSVAPARPMSFTTVEAWIGAGRSPVTRTMARMARGQDGLDRQGGAIDYRMRRAE